MHALGRMKITGGALLPMLSSDNTAHSPYKGSGYTACPMVASAVFWSMLLPDGGTKAWFVQEVWVLHVQKKMW